MAKMSAEKIIEQIPFKSIFLIQVLCNCGCLQFAYLIQFVCIRRMMRFDEIDPTGVETEEASRNLETAGYPELFPFLRWVRRNASDVHAMTWEHEIVHRLTTLGVAFSRFPVTIDPHGHRYGRFSELNSLNHFRHQVLTSEIDLFFWWDNICRIRATHLHHTQSFVVGTFCVNVENSLTRFPIDSMRRRCWELMLGVV